MKIFFSMWHLGSFRMYEPVIRELAARGHEIHLALGRAEAPGLEQGARHAGRRPSVDQLELAVAADRGVLGRAGQDHPAVGRLPALLPSGLRPDAEAEGARRGAAAAAARAISNRPAFQRPREPPAARRRCCAALERALPPVPEIEQRAARARARPRADHAARLPRVVAVRGAAHGARAGHPHGVRRRQLGSPVEQGAHPRHAASRVRVERDAEATRPCACTACRRSASSSPARSATTSGSAGARSARARSSAARVGLPAGPAVHPLCLLGAVLGQSGRGGVRAPLGAEPARERAPELRDGGRPDPAAPGAHGRVGDGRPLGLRARVAVRLEPGGRRVEGRLLRVALLQQRGRRPEHQRVPRRGDRRPAGAHGPAARVPGEPGRRAALPLPAARSAAACCRPAAPSRSTTLSWSASLRTAGAESAGARRSCARSSARTASTSRRRRCSATPSRSCCGSRRRRRCRRRPASSLLRWVMSPAFRASAADLRRRDLPRRLEPQGARAAGAPQRARRRGAQGASGGRARARKAQTQVAGRAETRRRAKPALRARGSSAARAEADEGRAEAGQDAGEGGARAPAARAPGCAPA